MCCDVCSSSENDGDVIDLQIGDGCVWGYDGRDVEFDVLCPACCTVAGKDGATGLDDAIDRMCEWCEDVDVWIESSACSHLDGEL